MICYWKIVFHITCLLGPRYTFTKSISCNVKHKIQICRIAAWAHDQLRQRDHNHVPFPLAFYARTLLSMAECIFQWKEVTIYILTHLQPILLSNFYNTIYLFSHIKACCKQVNVLFICSLGASKNRNLRFIH